jgi:hypothetical protein
MARPGVGALIVVVGMLFTYSCAQQGKTPPSEHQQKVNAPEHQQQEQIPSTARIVCFGQDGDEIGYSSYTRVSPSTVAAQPDGVHIRFDNRLGERASYFIEAGAPTEPPLTPPTGVPVPKGKSKQVAEFSPGLTKIACHLPGYYVENYDYFEVVGGDSGYKSLELECKPSAVPQHRDMMVASRAGSDFELVSYRDPVKKAREYFSDSLKEGDVVEEAGYPEDSDPPVRVVRNGKVIAVVDFDRELVSRCQGQF